MIITILRKPLEGTVAENTLKHGCGALNIDATRVGNEARTYKGSGKSNQVHSESRAGMSDGRGKDLIFKAEGRWPANFILIHKEGCELIGNKKIKVGKKYTENGGGVYKKGLYEDGLKVRGNDPYQGEETISDWDCEEGCPVKNLDDQSGVLKSGAMDSIAKGGQYTTFGKMYERRVQNPASEGGASRFFKQFKKENDQ